jgi:hypothetical protein|tara:strand:+ start:589 stop:879 length:291 start_codon:yes stop_codon:yes gene_type:complete
MATLISASLDVTKITKARLYDGKYLNITISVNDETTYGNNCGVYENQTKEEREAKAKRNYVGNGKVVWTDGKITVAEKEEKKEEPKVEEKQEDLPF